MRATSVLPDRDVWTFEDLQGLPEDVDWRRFEIVDGALVVGGRAEASGVVRLADDPGAVLRDAGSKYTHHRATLPANAITKAVISATLGWRIPASGAPIATIDSPSAMMTNASFGGVTAMESSALQLKAFVAKVKLRSGGTRAASRPA